jgi:hypothetical protein
MVPALTWSYYRIRFADWLQDEREKEARASTERAVARASGILVLNRQLMGEYHEMARSQAANSYRNSQIAMGVGLALLIIGSWIVLTANSTSSKIALAGLTTVGTVLGGYVATTFLRAHQLALAQLNFYFRQPLVDNYLVNAERVARDMDANARPRALSTVVNGFLAVSLAATGQPAVENALKATSDMVGATADESARPRTAAGGGCPQDGP